MARVAAIVTNGCNPDPRVLRQARWLFDAGHEVTIHAFDRMQNLPQEENLHGIQIIRHRVGITPYGGTISTALGLRNFLKSVKRRIGEIDLLHCHDADTLPLVGSVTNAKVLFDMHDLHHTWVRMPAPNSIIRRMASSRMKRNMLRRGKKVDSITTSCQGFTDWLGERGLTSYPIENRPPLSTHPNFPASRAIGYFGKVREIYSFKLLFEAIQSLSSENRVKIIIAGDGTMVKQVQLLAQRYPDLEIDFIGKFSHQEFPQLMSKINLMFALYSPLRGNIEDGALPSKMFEAAAYGRPSIVNANTPMGTLCESERLGLAVNWGDVQGLANAITELKGVEVELEIDESRERKRFFEVIEKLRI